MRIVGGRHKRRNLSSPKGQATRPTSDRTRESVFNILNHLLPGGFQGIAVADLFAGTGALGLEAISRGAAQAVFVDNARPALDCINENIAVLGEEDSTTVIKSDASRFGPPPPNWPPVNLAFLDPPYGKALAAPALSSLRDNGWLAEGAVCVIEIGKDETLEIPDGFKLLDERIYGAAKITILAAIG